MTQPIRQLVARRGIPLTGRIRVPGDKSISHRALMLGALAIGETRVDGLLEGEDVLQTAAAMRALGAEIARQGPGRWSVHGVGVGGLTEPSQVLDMGNSGTAARLLLGLLATHPITSFMTGDGSLVRRPMARVTDPLSLMGATFLSRAGSRLPLAIRGAEDPVPVEYLVPVPSAQVKSAILLAGLNAPGRTTVRETAPTRDHTESMLRAFGADLQMTDDDDGTAVISVAGWPRLTGQAVTVPGDISSAAFPLVAAAIVPDSSLVLEGVGLNPRRTGLLDTLIEMGADIVVENPREVAGEAVGDLRVRHRSLKGVTVPPDRAPRMIDEYPILAVAAACAEGETRMLGVGELRVKETDRLTRTAEGLAQAGVTVEAGQDWLTIRGSGRPPAGGTTVATALDHRIAMSFLVLGLATGAPVAIDDAAPIDTSFPDFAGLMSGLGADLSAPQAQG